MIKDPPHDILPADLLEKLKMEFVRLTQEQVRLLKDKSPEERGKWLEDQLDDS